MLIVHFRSAPSHGLKQPRRRTRAFETGSAGTDGVSLEMMKRRTLLEAMGHQVAICSAFSWADLPIAALEFDSGEVRKMMRNLFGPGIADFAGEAELEEAFNASVLHVEQQLGKAIKNFKPDMLFVHNILSLPVHPAATIALTELLRDTRLPCAAIHHDILSEGAYKFTPTCKFAKSILEGYFPPTMPNLRHWTINSRNKNELKESKTVEAKVIHDTMDFDQKLEPAEQTRIRALLRGKQGIKPNDIVLFVGARIVPNKQAEIAGRLTAVLQNLRQGIVGKKLYNGEVFSEESRIVLVLAGRPERAFADYQKRLFELLDVLKTDWVYVGDEVRPLRSEEQGFYALYPDMYTMADFVLYPTGWEGFGNQLLETFAAGLPVAVFEYPVFKEDIAPKGVEVVSLGDTILESRDSRDLVQVPVEVLNWAAREMLTILTTADRFQSMTSRNFMVGKRYFSFDVLRAHLLDAIDWAKSIKVSPS